MKWFEIKVETTAEASDAVSEMFMSIGAGGVAIDDPNEFRSEVEKLDSPDYIDEEYVKSLGNTIKVKAYFPDGTNIIELQELIKEKLNFISAFLDVGKGYEGYTEINEEDWSTAWRKYYKPVHLSDKIVIKPSWEVYEANKGEMVIEMDPGMAFGTGTHETTKMCGQLIEKYVKSGDQVIDVGCGSGILSIIAAKLGASKVEAVDVDEVAVKVTRENIQKNNVSDKVNVQKGELGSMAKFEADIVVANIIASIIIDITKIVQNYLKKDGYFITSGIIRERKQEVIDNCAKYGFKLEEALEQGEWVAMVFRCQDFL